MFNDDLLNTNPNENLLDKSIQETKDITNKVEKTTKLKKTIITIDSRNRIKKNKIITELCQNVGNNIINVIGFNKLLINHNNHNLIYTDEIIFKNVEGNIGNIPLELINYNNNKGGPIFSIKIISKNSYEIELNKQILNAISITQVGGNNIVIEKIVDFVQGYNNACSYRIDLGKKFINIRKIKLLSIEMPNAQFAIRNKQKDNLFDTLRKEDFNTPNDNIYWINEDEKIVLNENFLISNNKLLQLNNNENVNNNNNIFKANDKIESLFNKLEYKYNSITEDNLKKKTKELIIFLNNLKNQILILNKYLNNKIDLSLDYLFNFNINLNGSLLINSSLLESIIYNPFLNYNITISNNTFELLSEYDIKKGGIVKLLTNNNILIDIIITNIGYDYIEDEIVKILLIDNDNVERELIIKLKNKNIKTNIKFYLENPLQNKIVPQLNIDNIYFKEEHFNTENVTSEEDLFNLVKNVYDENNDTYIVRNNNNISKQATSNKFMLGFKFDKSIIINRYTLKVPKLVIEKLFGLCNIRKGSLNKIIGTDTLFNNSVKLYDILKIDNIKRRVLEIVSNTELITEYWDQEYINVNIEKSSHEFPKKWKFQGANGTISNKVENNLKMYNYEESDVSWETIEHINIDNVNYLDDKSIELIYNWDTDNIYTFDLNNTKKYKYYRIVVSSNFRGDLNMDINDKIYLSEFRMYTYIYNSNIFYNDLLFEHDILCNFIDYYKKYIIDNNVSTILYNNDNDKRSDLLYKLNNELLNKEVTLTNISERKEFIKNNYINIISTRIQKYDSIYNDSLDDILYDKIQLHYKYIDDVIFRKLKEIINIYNNYSYNGKINNIHDKVSNIQKENYWNIKNNFTDEYYIEKTEEVNKDYIVEGLPNENLSYKNINTKVYTLYPIHNIVIQQGNYNESKFISEVVSKMNFTPKLRYNYNRKDFEEDIEYDEKLLSEIKPVYHKFEISLNGIKQTIKIKQRKKIFQYSNANKDISNENGPIYCNESYPYLYIKHRNHNFKTGDIIDINGASGIFNISAGEINISHSIYVHDTHRCSLRLLYPIISSLKTQINELRPDNINIFKEFYNDSILYNNNSDKLLNYTQFQSNNSFNELGFYNILSKTSDKQINYNTDIDIILSNELIIKISDINLSKKYNKTIGRISHINKRNKNTGNYLVDYMLLSENNFKMGDIIKTSVSNCIAMIVPSTWSNNSLPTFNDIKNDLILDKIENGYDGYSIQVSTSPNKTTLTGLGGINMSISIPIKSSLLFNYPNTPYKELGFEKQQLDFNFQHMNSVKENIFDIDYIYVENDYSTDKLDDRFVIIKTTREHNFNVGDKIYINDFSLYTDLFKTTPNTILEIDNYEPFINWFDNLDINYQKILKQNIDSHELHNLFTKCVIVYYTNKYNKEQIQYLGNIGMNLEQYDNINDNNYNKNPFINLFSINNYSYVYIYYNQKKTNITITSGESILTGLSDGYYKVLGNLPHRFIGYTNSVDNINSVIIDISSSKTFPDTYNITNSITHKYTFTDSVTTETYTPLDIYGKTNDSLNVNEYYINNSTTPYNVLDGTLNRGIIRSHIKNIKVCGNNDLSNNTIFDDYILMTNQIISSNIIRIGLKNNEKIPILYRNYYQINKLILINNEKINIIKTIEYNELYYEISLYYEDIFNININIIPYHSISFIYSNTKKNQNKINIYKYNFSLDDLYNKCITINSFATIESLTNKEYVNEIANINSQQDNIDIYNIENVKSNSSNDYNIVIDIESYLLKNFQYIYNISGFYLVNDNINIDIINDSIKYISNFLDLNNKGYITNIALLQQLQNYILIFTNTFNDKLNVHINNIENKYNKKCHIIYSNNIIYKNISNYEIQNINISHLIIKCTATKSNNSFVIYNSYPIQNNTTIIFNKNIKEINNLVINQQYIIKNLNNNTFQLYHYDNNTLLEINEDITTSIDLQTNITSSVLSSWRPIHFYNLIEYIFDFIILNYYNIYDIWNYDNNATISQYLNNDINEFKFNISLQQETQNYLYSDYIKDYILITWLLYLSNNELTHNQTQIINIMKYTNFPINFNIDYPYTLYNYIDNISLFKPINSLTISTSYITPNIQIIYDVINEQVINNFIVNKLIQYPLENNIGQIILYGMNNNYSSYDDDYYSYITHTDLINYNTDNKFIHNFSNNTPYRYYKFTIRTQGLLEYKFSPLTMTNIILKNNNDFIDIQYKYHNTYDTFKYIPFSILDTITQDESITLDFNTETSIITFNTNISKIITYFNIISDNTIKLIQLYGILDNNEILINSYDNVNLTNNIINTFTNETSYQYYKFKLISLFNSFDINTNNNIIIKGLVVGNIYKYDYNKLYIEDNNYIVDVVDKDIYYELILEYDLINSHLKGENIIIMEPEIEHNMFNTQNIIINGEWHTRLFYEGNYSIYNQSHNTYTLYKNQYKIFENVILDNKIITQIHSNNNLINKRNDILINEDNNTLYLSVNNIYYTIIIPSQIIDNYIYTYTPTEFSSILQETINNYFINIGINFQINVEFIVQNQIFYFNSNINFNLHYNNNIDTIMRTIGFSRSQLNNNNYYTNSYLILYQNSELSFDISNNNKEIYLYRYYNNQYIDCTTNYSLFNINKTIKNKIITFSINNNALINHLDDYNYNLIWSFGTINKNDINNNLYTGNVIIQLSHKKEGYPYFQPYLPNDIYVLNMKGLNIPNNPISLDTITNSINIKKNKEFITPLTEQNYKTPEIYNLDYIYNNDYYNFHIKQNKLLNTGCPIRGYFKNNYYVSYKNNYWCVYNGDNLLKEFNNFYDANDYFRTLSTSWVNTFSDEMFYINYHSVLVKGKYKGVGGLISNRWHSKSNVMNDFFFGFTIKELIKDKLKQNTKIKLIVRLRDLGVKHPEQFLGDIESIPRNNLRPYILGVGGKIFQENLNNPVDIGGDKYIYLSIKDFNTIIDINKNINAFAKIILPSAPGKDLYNNFISTDTLFDHKPLDELTQLDIQFFDVNGKLFNFSNLNHSFTLEITEEIEYITDTNINSDSIFSI